MPVHFGLGVRVFGRQTGPNESSSQLVMIALESGEEWPGFLKVAQQFSPVVCTSNSKDEPKRFVQPIQPLVVWQVLARIERSVHKQSKDRRLEEESGAAVAAIWTS